MRQVEIEAAAGPPPGNDLGTSSWPSRAGMENEGMSS